MKRSTAWLLLCASVLSTVHASAFEIDHDRLDPALVRVIERDLQDLKALQIKEKKGSWFEKIFGGRDQFAVIRFLEERIHYIGMPDDDEDVDTNIMAQNYGPSFLEWVFKTRYQGKRKRKHAFPEIAKFRSTEVALSSPRTGFVAVGPSYQGPETGRIGRLDTLVHEARHSDCVEVPQLKDLRAYQDDRIADMSLKARACTHIHTPCPDGPLAGDFACDAHAWGAYSVGLIFDQAIAQACENCTAADREEAKRLMDDNESRLLPDLRYKLNKGKLPPPDMRSVE
jgi:hypothetical protein